MAISDAIQTDVEQAIARALPYLQGSQRADGSWDAPVEFEPAETAIYLLGVHYLGRSDQQLDQEVAEYLRYRQEPCGGWAGWPGGPPLLDSSVLCYAALRAAGTPADDPALARARTAIDRLGGWLAAGFIPRLLLALLGQIPAAVLPRFSPHSIGGPRRLAWTRPYCGLSTLGIPALTLLTADGAVRSLPEGRSLAELELHRLAWKMTPASPADGSFKPSDRWRYTWKLVEVASRAIRWGERWFPGHQAQRFALQAIRDMNGPEGSYLEVLISSLLNLMALDSAGGPAMAEHVDRGAAALRSWLVHEPFGARQQISPSTTFITSYGVRALLAAGISTEDASIRSALAWLERHQWPCRQGRAKLAEGDESPAGWCFGVYGKESIDVDTTVIVLEAWRPAMHLCPRAFARAVAWVLRMQDRSGGWAAWTSGSRRLPWISSDIFYPLAMEVLEPAIDITARTLIVLGPLMGSALDHRGRITRAVGRGVKFLWQRRRPDGSWYGRWVVNYAPCTGQVLEAFRRCGVDPDEPRMAKSIRWLKSVQNADGGWGESKDSYRTHRFEPGPSNPGGTCLVMAGLAAVAGDDDPSVVRAVRYLLCSQETGGRWEDSGWNGVQIPGISYTRYHFSPTAMATATLSDWLRRRRSSVGDQHR